MPLDFKVASPPAKPLLVYDGECQFCCRWITRWKNSTGDAITYLPFQDSSVVRQFPEIPPENFQLAVHLILPDGSICDGAEAVFRALSEGGRERWLYRLYKRFSGFADATELLYEEVATHRSFLSKLDRIYSGPGVTPLGYVGVRFLFLRGMALIYLIAFASLLVQIQGLAGSHGIVPAHAFMSQVKEEVAQAQIGLDRYHLFPTLAWWDVSDRALNWQCAGGIGLSVLLLFGIAPAPVLFLLWCLYLSLSTVCSPFLNFQWDTLLLESGFLAIFFAPWQWWERPSRQSRPSALALWLLRWLIFRLMIESGFVKLMSGDLSWWNLTALRFHYGTQPLPTWIGWYAHQLPNSVQSVCAFLLLVVEVVVPILIFAGRRARLIAAGLFIALQVLIMLTGNYTFFNWLTIVLCLPLLDDDVLKRWFGKVQVWAQAPSSLPRCRRWPRWVMLPLTILIGTITLVQVLGAMRVPEHWPRPVIALYQWVEPFRTFNVYGLFAVMTKKRPEIIIEGSNDRAHWQPYEFKYKPGNLKKRPQFVAPYQPRLDWQMWFAALGGVRENPWFISFEWKLLQNSPEVLALMGPNPFPKAPPKYIRALLYEYHFTDLATRRATGQWWRREYQSVFVPPLSLEDFRLAAAGKSQ